MKTYTITLEPKNILFVDCIKKNATVKRQLSPKLFAMTSEQQYLIQVYNILEFQMKLNTHLKNFQKLYTVTL